MIVKSVSRRWVSLGARLQLSSRNSVRREHGCGFSNIGKCRAFGTVYHSADKHANTGAISNAVSNKQKGSAPNKRYGMLSTGLFLCGSSYGTMNYFANPEAPNVGKAVFSTYRPTQPLLEEDGHVPVYATSQANDVISAEIILYQYKICPFCNARRHRPMPTIPWNSIKCDTMVMSSYEVLYHVMYSICLYCLWAWYCHCLCCLWQTSTAMTKLNAWQMLLGE